MSWKLRVLVPALLLAPQAVMALGLGDIRLNSALNEPLAAEIDLVAATPEEVSALQAHLASQELFQRYGLDRPQFLDSLQFRVAKGSDGRSVLQVRSTTPMTEPFVTFLVEASWSSGRLLREYTVLLNPPVYEPGEIARPSAAAPAVSAPTARPAAAAPASAPAPSAVAEAPAAPAAERPGTINVRHNDTLLGIASQLATGQRATNQMAVALYRANPQAFGGNINRLKAGAELRVPDAAAIAAVSSGEAAREIAEQTNAWRSTTESSARLRLVTPQDSGAAAAAAAPAAGGAASADEVRRLQQELADTKRLLELKSSELAQLQSRVAQQPAVQPTTTPTETPTEAPVAPEDDVGAGKEAAAPTPEAAQAEIPKPPKPPKPPVKAKPKPAAEPSFLDSLADNWTWLLGAAAAVLGGLMAFGYIRRRREEEEGDALAVFTPTAPPPAADDATRMRAYQPPPPASSGVVVEEQQATGTMPLLRMPAAGGAAARLDDTMSAEAAVNIDQTDPLAEADFHMAYGLYDQAADLMRLALDREPGRRDFKLKLLEIFFVWGNKQRFVDTARELYDTRAHGAAGEWDRVAIMGRQIAPGESMFAGAPSAAVAGDLIDLNLGSGDNPVDIDVFAPAAGDSVDLDLGDALAGADPLAATGRNQAIDFDLDASETTANGETPTVEMPGPDGHTITLDMIGPNAPTVEQPRLHDVSLPTDATATMSIDDLGLDLSELEAMAQGSGGTDLGTSSTTLVADAAAFEATRIQPPRSDEAITAELPSLGATSVMKGIDLDLSDLDLGIEQTQKLKPDATASTDATGIIDATGILEMTSRERALEMDLEPVTMSEVGTKLDLARAYVDMGDPEGARSILQEVLAEGSAGQKQEAQRLVDSLRGNA